MMPMPRRCASRGMADGDGLAVDADARGVGGGRPGEDAGEGAFSGAVFADQGMDFTGAEFEMDVCEGRLRPP